VYEYAGYDNLANDRIESRVLLDKIIKKKDSI
jgi:hypothetical protein